jgi:uncharacterized membrane protein YeaQ/YmgE (transglycosylase-associated protein family)
MGHVSSLLAWIGFGLCAAIIAMVLPFHRGVRGILTNIGVGVGGAVAGGYLARAIGLYHDSASPAGFLYAAAGAVFGLVAFHALWSRRHASHHVHSA